MFNNARIKGPKIKPINPNTANPPKTPTKTSTGCIFVVELSTFGLIRLSIMLISNAPYTNRPIPFQIILLLPNVIPFIKVAIDNGSHTNAVPINGTNAKKNVTTAHINGDAIPNIQKPKNATKA